MAKTDPSAGAKGVSLIGIETQNLEGYSPGRKLDKMGQSANDTAELNFEDCRLPAANLLGAAEGRGFYQLMSQLPWERLVIGIMSLGASRKALEITLDYVKERKAFGNRVLDFQNTRFKLAELATKVDVLGSYVDRCLDDYVAGSLSPERASMVKLFGTEVQCEAVDECLQFHGGYGYMNEYLICQMFADARVQKIYAGTNEIMKELISRELER